MLHLLTSPAIQGSGSLSHSESLLPYLGPIGKGKSEESASPSTSWIEGSSCNLWVCLLFPGLVWTHPGCHVPGSLNHLQPPGERFPGLYLHPVGPGPSHPRGPPACPPRRHLSHCHQRYLGEDPVSPCLCPPHVFESAW